MSTVLEQVKDIVAATLSVDRATITDDSHLMDDLNVDSLGKMELVMKLEDAFDINIPENETDSILTIKSIADFISAQKAA
ncbi:MAG: Acyl carrier protein [Holosporales bacterium]